jgi:hypothetical protein
MNSFDRSTDNVSNDNENSADTTNESKSVDTSLRRILWRHYSNSFHFFGGSLFPTTTTSTTTLYNSSGRDGRNTRAVNHRRDHCVENDTNSSKYLKYSSNSPGWSQTLPQFRPTDQLLKLIRRRRALVSNNNTEGINNTRNRIGNNNGQDDNDDSWNAIRYHVISRPFDCQYVCYNSNLSTPLHAACLHRAPNDVILMILTAWPEATVLQDAEGWTPLHVHILYSNTNDAVMNGTKESFCSATATESLIRLGGAEAAAQHSKFVGSALHLACRHNIGLSVLAELLQVCPEQVRIRNEAGGLPANLQWAATYKEKMRLFQDRMHPFREFKNYQSVEITEWQRIEDDVDVDLLVRLCLFLGAFQNQPILLDQAMQTMNYPLYSLHDVVAFHYECSERSNFVGLYLKFFPQSVTVSNHCRRLPLHVAASYSIREIGETASSFVERNSQSFVNPGTTMLDTNSVSTTGRQAFGSGRSVVPALGTRQGSQQNLLYIREDPLELLLRVYPEGASEQESEQDRLPLFVALIKGNRTWGTGIASLVRASPSSLELKDKEMNLFPFQIAAAKEVCIADQNLTDLRRLETIFNLLLACPHVVRP